MSMSSERSIRFTNRSIENKTDNSISRRLTLKQRLFVDEYISNGGNGTRAVIAAGYNTTTQNSIWSLASKNLKNPLIQLALEEAGYRDCGAIDEGAIQRARSLSEKGKKISSREDRAAFLTSVYEDESVHINARLKAVFMLGRMYGDYLERVARQDHPVEMPVLNIVYSKEDD